MTGEQLLKLLTAGQVKRYHAQLTLKEQTVAEHSHSVAMLCWAITGGSASAALLMAALTHDLGERWTGDMPAPVKNGSPFVHDYMKDMERRALRLVGYVDQPLSDQESRVLKLADALDGLLFCWREWQYGNQHLANDGVHANYADYAASAYTAVQNGGIVAPCISELIAYLSYATGKETA